MLLLLQLLQLQSMEDKTPLFPICRRRCGYLPAGVSGSPGPTARSRAGEPEALQGAEPGPGGDQASHLREAGPAGYQPDLEQLIW